MFEFELLEVNALGDMDATYGQRMWCKAVGEEHPISFNTKDPNIIPGMKIASEEKSMKKSAKGNIYWQLKKVKVLSGSQEEAVPNPAPGTIKAEPSTPAADSVTVTGDIAVKQQLDRIEAKLDKLLGNDSKLDSVAEVPEDVDLNALFPE